MTTWTAKSLTDRTFSLLKKYPIFVLPVAVADLLGFTAMHIQHALHQPLFNLFLNDGGSVLSQSHSPLRLTPENATKVALLTFPLIWGCYFLSIYFYANALLAVEGLLGAIHNDELIDTGRIWGKRPKEQRRLLRFSLLILGLCAVGAAISYFLFAIILHIPLLAEKMGFDLGIIVAFLAGIAVVYFSAIPTLRLLGRPDLAHNGELVRLVRGLFVATLAIQSAIALSFRHLLPDFLFQQTTVMGFLLRQIIESLIGAFPYVLLFIAFSVLVSEMPIVSPSATREDQSEDSLT